MATLEQLRALRYAQPFHPFRVRMPSGETYTVTDGLSIGCAPDGRHMSIAGGPLELDMQAAVFETLDDQTLAELDRPRPIPMDKRMSVFSFQPHHLDKLLRAEPFRPFTVHVATDISEFDIEHDFCIRSRSAARLEDDLLVIIGTDQEYWVCLGAIVFVKIQP
jgi:hypothetical protein